MGARKKPEGAHKVPRRCYLTPAVAAEFDRLAATEGESAFLARLVHEALERDRKAQRKASRTVEAGV